jgi:zinc transporter 5/7
LYSLVSIEIIFDAIHRLHEGHELRRLNELLLISVLGFLVNIIGLTAFGHAHHGHSHEGHSHDHSHEHTNEKAHFHSHEPHSHSHEHTQEPHSHFHEPHAHTHDQHTVHSHDNVVLNGNGDTKHLQPHPSPIPSLPPTPFSIPPTPGLPPTPSHSHSHDHNNENMQGIFLHILADALGSVAVIISTLMTKWDGWSGWDPLASCAIAILIFISAMPLVRNSGMKLLLALPNDTEYLCRDILQGVSELRGVSGYSGVRFWLGDSAGDEAGLTRGVIHIIAAVGIDLEDVRERTALYLKGRGVDAVVHVEREVDTKCWCRSGRGQV